MTLSADKETSFIEDSFSTCSASRKGDLSHALLGGLCYLRVPPIVLHNSRNDGTMIKLTTVRIR